MSKLNKYLNEIQERVEAIKDEPEWDIEPRNCCFYNKDLSKLLPKSNALYLDETNQNCDHLGADLVGHLEPNRMTYTVRTAWFLLNARQDVEVLLKIVKHLEQGLKDLTNELGSGFHMEQDILNDLESLIPSTSEGEGE